jgi:hypothetical protein
VSGLTDYQIRVVLGGATEADTIDGGWSEAEVLGNGPGSG